MVLVSSSTGSSDDRSMLGRSVRKSPIRYQNPMGSGSRLLRGVKDLFCFFHSVARMFHGIRQSQGGFGRTHIDLCICSDYHHLSNMLHVSQAASQPWTLNAKQMNQSQDAMRFGVHNLEIVKCKPLSDPANNPSTNDGCDNFGCTPT
jgi:hypothetical protein